MTRHNRVVRPRSKRIGPMGCRSGARSDCPPQIVSWTPRFQATRFRVDNATPLSFPRIQTVLPSTSRIFRPPMAPSGTTAHLIASPAAHAARTPTNTACKRIWAPPSVQSCVPDRLAHTIRGLVPVCRSHEYFVVIEAAATRARALDSPESNTPSAGSDLRRCVALESSSNAESVPEPRRSQFEPQCNHLLADVGRPARVGIA